VYSKYHTISMGATFYEAPEAFYSSNRFIGGINDVYRLGMSILSLYDPNLYTYLPEYYSDIKNIRLDTSNITNPEIKKIVDMMITIDYKNRPQASELLKDSIFDIYNKLDIYNSQRIRKYKLKIKPFKYYSRDISDLNIYDRKNILASEINIIRFRKKLLEWIWESYIRIDWRGYPNLFLHTCTLVDNYLAFNITDTKNLEIICASAIFISVIFYTNINITDELVNLSDNRYTIQQLNCTVIQMLQFFDYKIYINTPDLWYEYKKPYRNDSLYIKVRELVVKPESFGIIHIFDELE